MINELIEEIGRERIQELAHTSYTYRCTPTEQMMMARALLAVLDAKPFLYMDKDDLEGYPLRNYLAEKWINEGAENILPLYTTPPAASVPDGWKLVPAEATPEILQAGIMAHYELQQYQQPEDAKFIGPMECAYNAMIAAAPAPGGE